MLGSVLDVVRAPHAPPAVLLHVLTGGHLVTHHLAVQDEPPRAFRFPDE